MLSCRFVLHFIYTKNFGISSLLIGGVIVYLNDLKQMNYFKIPEMRMMVMTKGDMYLRIK